MGKVPQHSRATANIRWRAAWCLGWLLVALPGGCVPAPTIRPLTEELRAPSGESGKAVVLFRITARIGTETVAHPPYRLELAGAAGRGSEAIRVFAPSRQARAEGWGYFLVEPGDYRLGVAFLFFGYPSAQFRLTADTKDSIVYVGSLSIRCRRQSMLLFTLTTNCSAITVTNEAGSMETLATGALPMSTRLLRTIDEP